jgi:hypothetical protein
MFKGKYMTKWLASNHEEFSGFPKRDSNEKRTSVIIYRRRAAMATTPATPAPAILEAAPV